MRYLISTRGIAGVNLKNLGNLLFVKPCQCFVLLLA